MLLSRIAMLTLLVFAGAKNDAGTPDRRPWVLVVHPNNSLHHVSRKFVREIFLKRTTYWPDGELARPADLKPDSESRDRFSHDVMGMSVQAVREYWQRQIFTGRGTPPPELESDKDMLRHVSAHLGAVGYVSGAARLDGVRLVEVR